MCGAESLGGYPKPPSKFCCKSKTMLKKYLKRIITVISYILFCVLNSVILVEGNLLKYYTYFKIT